MPKLKISRAFHGQLTYPGSTKYTTIKTDGPVAYSDSEGSMTHRACDSEHSQAGFNGFSGAAPLTTLSEDRREALPR